MPSWWVRRGEQVFGPMDEAMLADSLRQGRIDPGDLACREGGKEWLLVTAIPAVARVFAPKPSSPPVEQDQWREAVWMLGNLDGEILEGPLSLEDVRQGIQSGRLTGGELVARVGSSVWQQIAEVMEAKRRLSGQPPSTTAGASGSMPSRASIPPVATPVLHPSVVHVRPPEPVVPRPPPMMHATQTAPVAPMIHAPPVRPTQPTPAPGSRPPGPPPRSAPPRPPGPPPRTMATTQTAPRPPHAPPHPPPQPPPPPPPPASVGWYVSSRDGQSLGPFTLEQIQQGVAQGQLAAETMICRTDDYNWRPLATFPEIAARRSGPPPLPSRR